VDCDDVSWRTVINNRLNCTSVTAILELHHIVTITAVEKYNSVEAIRRGERLLVVFSWETVVFPYSVVDA